MTIGVPEAMPCNARDQAWAWLKATQPSEYARLDYLLEDWERNNEIQLEVLTRWLDQPRDPLILIENLSVAVVQAEAWLGNPLKRTWQEAHTLAVGRDEWDHDRTELTHKWWVYGEEPDLPPAVSDYVLDLSRSRLERLSEAKEWLGQHDPKWLAERQRCRNFADYIEDEWQDDRRAVERYLTRSVEKSVSESERQQEELSAEPQTPGSTHVRSGSRSWIRRTFGL